MARARRSQFALSSGACGDDLAEQHHAVADVVLLERGVGLAAQLRQRLGDLPGVVLDLGFELDRGFVELGALERLAGGGRRNGTQGNGRKGDERGNAGRRGIARTWA